MREAGWSAVDRSDGAGGRVQSGHGRGGGGQPVDQELAISPHVFILQARLDLTEVKNAGCVGLTLDRSLVLPWRDVDHPLRFHQRITQSGSLLPPFPAGGEGSISGLNTQTEGRDGGGGGLGRHIKQLWLSPSNP